MESAGEENVCTQALEYIEENYSDSQLTLTMMGDMLGMTPSYLSKLFKDKYQLSIPDYISRTRINHAKRQLRETNCSIQEIAQDNGFLNSNSFIRVFKKQEGITPGVYRGLSDEQAAETDRMSGNE
jgi:AraC-like DNA-binding protein